MHAFELYAKVIPAAISITYWFATAIAIDLQSGLGFFR